MVVQHNLTAMNSNRMLNVNTKTQAKSTEKLSSGYKINRAADDAAGLSISEKMRKQIRGLTQASANAQDGISAVQTAEGALNEVQDMLQRMNELAVKAANGTNSVDDRSYIQNEVDQLVTEIDRVAETTKFNETYLLKGDKTKTDYTFATKALGSALGGDITTSAVDGADVAWASKTGSAEAVNKFMNALKTEGIEITSSASAVTSATVKGYDISVSGTTGTVKDESGNAVGTITLTKSTAAGTKTVKASAYTTYFDTTATKFYDANGNKISNNALDNYVSYDGTTNISLKDGAKLYDAAGNEVTASLLSNQTNLNNMFGATAITGAQTLKLHVGADATSNNQISVDIKAMSAKGIGVDGIKVDGPDDSKALDAIETIKAAIQKISTQRSALGAVQNRLDHTISNLDNVVENTTSAESQIRDTDMATEMVKYSNNNILSQAGQAMLAQANQANQGVLSLLG